MRMVQEAEAHLVKAEQGRRETLGEKHREALEAMTFLALLLQVMPPLPLSAEHAARTTPDSIYRFGVPRSHLAPSAHDSGSGRGRTPASSPRPRRCCARRRREGARCWATDPNPN